MSEVRLPTDLRRKTQFAGLLANTADGTDLLEDSVFTRDGAQYQFSGKVKGISVCGEMLVCERDIRVRFNLPWAARPLRELAGMYIRECLEKALA